MFRYEPESKPLDGYTIKRAIQRGGFGEVYYALSDAGKEVALKLVLENTEVELRGVSQCLNLKHPNLLTIFDVKQDESGEYWIVMEFVSGKTLDQIIAEDPSGMPPDKVEQYLTGLTDGIEYLHERGMVHRDLKPANIFTEDGRVKIGDIGLAKFISASQGAENTQSVGTVYYMAPEIAHGKYDKSIDVYATGVILFEMLTGRVPFEGESTGEILMKQLTQEPDLSILPSAIRPVVKKALEKDPLKRTASVKELAEEFKAAVNGKYVASTTARSREPAQPKKKTYQSAVKLNDQGRGQRLNDPSDAPTQAAPPKNSPAPQPQRADKPAYQTDQQRMLAASEKIEVAWYQQSEFWWRSVLLFMVMLLFAPWDLPLVVLLGLPMAIGYGFFCVSSEEKAANPDAQVEYEAEQAAIEAVEDMQSTGQQVYSRAVRLNKPYVRNQSPIMIRNISMMQRGAEATGSMSIATVIGGAIAAVLWGTGTIPTEQSAVLFGGGTILASWMAILTGKFWEGRGGDGMTRRLMTGLMGALVGVGVFFIDHTLMVDLAVMDTGSLSKFMADKQILGNTLSGQDYERAVGFIAFFGVLLLVRRWWYHVDSYRDKRFSWITVAVTTVAAAVLSSIGNFDSQWAMMWGAAISTTAQLASVWAAPEERQSSQPNV
jgi:eukaryotic-like serine/threonine-protein kinase